MLHIEVRRKIIEARKNGLKIREICKAYSVGKTAVFNLLKQERETGDITPKTYMRGRKPALDKETLEALKQLLDTRKDMGMVPYIQRGEAIPIALAGITPNAPNFFFCITPNNWCIFCLPNTEMTDPKTIPSAQYLKICSN